MAGDRQEPKGYETLCVRRDHGIGWLIFNRPEAGNSMDAAMFSELERAWAELDADPSVRVIINTGEGTSFQTGLDVKQLVRHPEALREQSRRTKRSELKLTAWHNKVRKPVIAAINGLCAGGGLHFVADADIVIASTDASFVDPHVSIGQVSALEGIALARKSPMEAILRMVLVGRHERVTAQRAYDLGIVSDVVEPQELRAAATALAEKIAKNSPAAMAVTKRVLWNALEVGLTDACRQGSKQLVGLFGHPDLEEGPLAFTQRREPAWKEL